MPFFALDGKNFPPISSQCLYFHSSKLPGYHNKCYSTQQSAITVDLATKISDDHRECIMRSNIRGNQLLHYPTIFGKQWFSDAGHIVFICKYDKTSLVVIELVIAKVGQQIQYEL